MENIEIFNSYSKINADDAATHFSVTVLACFAIRVARGQNVGLVLSQNCTDFNSMQEIEDFFACIVLFTGLLNSTMLPKISREPRELSCQLHLAKLSQNCTDFSAAQEIEEFFA